MDYEPSGPFVTFILELKLDPTTLFEWQRHSQDSREAPHYIALLEFLDLRACASENWVHDTNQRRQTVPPEKISTKLSYHVNITDTCVACKSGKHPLYTYRKFRLLPRRQMMAILKEHRYCINCVKPGHFDRQCPCWQRCRKYQKPHHTWLHIDKEAQKQTKQVSSSNQTPGTVTHHSDLGGRHPIVLTTCEVQIVSIDGSMMKARTLLNSASSSFVHNGEFSTVPILTTLASLHESQWHRRFCNPSFLTRHGESQCIKSSWKDSGSGSSSAAQSHHQSATLSGSIQSQMETFVKYLSGWLRLWHLRKCWSAPRSWRLQPYNPSRLVVWPFEITISF